MHTGSHLGAENIAFMFSLFERYNQLRNKNNKKYIENERNKDRY